MKHYLEYKDEKSNKFWEIDIKGREYTVTFGKVGTNGTGKTKTFDSETTCLAEAKKVMQQKLKKGYIERNSNEISSNSNKAEQKTVAKKAAPTKETLTAKSISKDSSATHVKDVVSTIKAIEEHIERNELMAATDLSNELIAMELSEQEKQTAHRLVGRIAFLKNDFETAETALKLGGTAAYFLLGTLYTKQEKYTEALSYYEKSNSYQSYWEAGVFSRSKGNREDAIKYFKLAAEKGEKENEPAIWEVYLKLGALHHAEDIKLAEEYYLKTISYETADDRVYNNLAVLYITTDRFPEALAVLDNAIKKFPDQPLAYFNKCCWYAMQGKLDEANDFLEKAFKNGYDNYRQIKNDTDLAELRETTRFKQLSRKYDYGNRSLYDFEKGEVLKKNPEILLEYNIGRLTKDKQLPDGIENALNLKQLHVEGNLKSFPTAIFRLKKLEQLFLSETSIYEFPEEFLNMKLDLVSLETKRIPHFPVELSKQKGLKILRLTSPKFTEIPKEIAGFSSLTTLKIVHAPIDNIHREIGSLSNLRELSIIDTNLKQLPKEIEELQQLRILTLIDNANLKFLPECIFMLPELSNVQFSNNGFPSTEAKKLFDEGKALGTEKRLMAIFLALLQGNNEYVKKHATQKDILQALNSSVRNLRENALFWIEKQGKITTPVDTSSEVLLLGKFGLSITELKNKIKKQGITVAKKWNTTTTHVVIGEKPGDKLNPLLEKEISWVTEQQLNPRNKSEEVAVEMTEVMKTQIITLLRSNEDSNLTMALEMIEATQLQSFFTMELFLAYQFSGNQKNKKSIISLIKQIGDQELQAVFSKKYGFKSAAPKKINEYVENIPSKAGFDQNQFAYTIFKITKEKAGDYLLENGSSEQRKEVLDALIQEDELSFSYDSTLKEVPEEITDFKNLKKLDFKSLKLKEFPVFLTILHNVESLQIYIPRLKEIPKEISNLKKLKYLYINGHHFKSLPEVLFTLENIEKLELSYSKWLSNIPPGVSNLKNLKILDLRDTGITSLPDDFGELQALEELDLKLNKLTTLPANFSKLKNLKTLDITCLEKEMQFDYLDALLELSSLEKLFISTFQFDAFKNLSKLTSLKILQIIGRVDYQTGRNDLKGRDWEGEGRKILPNCNVYTDHDYIW